VTTAGARRSRSNRGGRRFAVAFAAALGGALGSTATTALASESKRESLTKESKAATPPPTPDEDEEPDREFEVGLEYASAYVFRGENVFKEQAQSEQKMVALPRFVWTPPDAGLSLGYSSAWQISGDNIGRNIDDGTGAEQDLFIDYDIKVVRHFTISTELTMWAYPAARSFPLFFEGSAEANYTGPIEVGFYVGYLFSARPGPLSEDHLYLSPHVEKTFALTDGLDLTTRVSAGWKLFKLKPFPLQSYSFDVLATETLSYSVNDTLTLGAKVGLAWANLEPQADPDTGEIEHFDFGDGLVAFVGLSVDLEFGRTHAP
jgi:hypothetical protein